MSFYHSFKQSITSYIHSSTNTPDIQYITKRLLTITFPSDNDTLEQQTNKLQQVAQQLNKLCNEQYLIINLSEKSYNYTLFNNNVIEYKYPGYPSTPLHNILHINIAIHNWLHANDNNLCVIHCATGTGRTILTLANYLVWSNVCSSMNDAILLICDRLQLNSDNNTTIIPTQQRYIQYMNSIYTAPHIIPSAQPIVIERIIMYTIPGFEQSNDNTVMSTQQCRPYLQCFKDAKLVFTSTGYDNKLHWYNSSNDNSIIFSAGVVCYGDILIRVRHISHSTKRISMLRFGVHTGLLPPGHITLQKSELDGACNDNRFNDDFFIELIYRTAEQSDIDNALNTDPATQTSSSTPTSTSSTDIHTALQNTTTDEYWQQLSERTTMQPLATHELITVPTATSIFTRKTIIDPKQDNSVPVATSVVPPSSATPVIAQPATTDTITANDDTSSTTTASDTIKQATESMRNKFSSLFSKSTESNKSINDSNIPVAEPIDNNNKTITDRQFSVGSDHTTTVTRPHTDSFDELQAYVYNLNNNNTTATSSDDKSIESTMQSTESQLDSARDSLHVTGRESLPPPNFGDHPALNLLGESTNSTPVKHDVSPEIDHSVSEQLMHDMNELTRNSTHASPIKQSAELEAALEQHLHDDVNDDGELDDEQAADMLAQLQAELSD